VVELEPNLMEREAGSANITPKHYESNVRRRMERETGFEPAIRLRAVIASAGQFLWRFGGIRAGSGNETV